MNITSVKSGPGYSGRGMYVLRRYVEMAAQNRESHDFFACYLPALDAMKHAKLTGS